MHDEFVAGYMWLYSATRDEAEAAYMTLDDAVIFEVIQLFRTHTRLESYNTEV